MKIIDSYLDLHFKDKDEKWRKVWRAREMPHEMPPAMMAGMGDAIDALVSAIVYNTPIAVVGDYDVDGMSSTAIMIRFLKTVGHTATVWYVPTRIDGYGLSRHVVDKVRDQLLNIAHIEPRTVSVHGIEQRKRPVLVTVDNGITAFDAVSYANKWFDVIVTDHHNLKYDVAGVAVSDSLSIPDALAVVNPQRPDCPYPTKHLSGSGVAFRVVCALCDYFANERPDLYSELPLQRDSLLQFSVESSEGFLDYKAKFYQLASFGTVADMMPLDELENRHIVYEGMKQMSEFPLPIFHAMMNHTETWLSSDVPVDYRTIGFSYAPAFNAVGRIGEPHVGVDALTSIDYERAKEFAGILLGYNNERKRLQKEALDAITQAIDANMNIFGSKACFVINAEVPSGLSGLLAGDLCRMYSRPVLVGRIKQASDGRTVFAGSARSTSTVPITDVFHKLSSYMVRYGGHDGAAGFEILQENADLFESAINDVIANQYPDWREPEVDHSDAFAIEVSDVNGDILIHLSDMQPFGDSSTPSPKFAVCKASVASATSWGAKGHLKATFNDAFGNKVEANAWGMGAEAERVNDIILADVVGEIELALYPYKHIRLNVLSVMDAGQCEFIQLDKTTSVTASFGTVDDDEPSNDAPTSGGGIPRIVSDGGGFRVMGRSERAKKYGDALSGNAMSGKRRL